MKSNHLYSAIPILSVRAWCAHGAGAIITAFLLIMASGCARPNPREALASVHMQAPEGSPKLLAIYQPWFGQRAHIDVGYSSQDPNILRQQIARARSLNISGFVVNW